MRLVRIGVDADLGLPRGSTAICVPVYDAFELFAQCIRSLLHSGPSNVPILVADDASPSPDVRLLLEELAAADIHDRTVYYLRQPGNCGFVANVNSAFTLLAPADVVVVNSDCVVPDGWHERLRAAAYSDTRVATASTLTNHGSILSIPARNRPTAGLPQDWSIEEAADAVAKRSLRLRPEIPTTVGHCMYIRRDALDLVGPFDLAFSPGYGEEVDFAQRCLLRGLSHVLADDVLVLHQGGGSFRPDGGQESPRQREHHEIIRSRYRYYDSMVQTVEADNDSPLARALSIASRAIRGTTVTIDGRALGPFVTGTQVHTLEVIAAVHARHQVNLRVVLPPEPGAYATDLLAQMVGLQTIVETDLTSDSAVSDVVHRPYQVTSLHDLELLRRLGRRIIITHQDLIAFRNPGYFPNHSDWAGFRELTRNALQVADRVVFFSHHAAREAVSDELVTEDRAQVVLLGTDHKLNTLRPASRPPRGVDRLDELPFLLCLGTDFKHKNRPFALRLLQALREHHNWNGRLVFAGPHVLAGSSAGEEARIRSLDPDLEDRVLNLPAVDEPGKLWLMERANAILYPTTYEGFGLLPFEAAEFGIPCIFAARTSVGELLPEALASIVPWDAARSAARTAPLLSDGPARREHIQTLQAAAARLTWTKTADVLVQSYETTADAPVRHASAIVVSNIAMQRDLEALEVLKEENRELWKRVDDAESGGGLVSDPVDRAMLDPVDGIPAELRRPLLAVSHRRALRTLVFGPMRLAYRAGRVFSRRSDRPALPSGDNES